MSLFPTFEKLRFYIDNAVDFEEFNLFTITRERFEVLYFCLSFETLLLDDKPKKAKEETQNKEEDITKALYNDYADFRNALFKDIQNLNPEYDKLTLFKKTQKLLDRFLFIFFAEDKNLLPPNLISSIIDEWQDLNERHGIPMSLYDKYKRYFEFLYVGHKNKYHSIFPYNGGLFKPDELLDNLKITNALLARYTQKISLYDFDSEVSVNILGHIFEHSLNDFEEIQAEIEGKEVEKTSTRRKKDGVFYTPKYITKYIVDNTVGKLCQDKKLELELLEETLEKNYEVENGKPIKNKKIREQLQEKTQNYKNWLSALTICDPACGSGAFLNQVLEFLIAEHHYVYELELKLIGTAFIDKELENKILRNNIFGVDINEESVEIAKLSLWLRTAYKGRKLTTLNDNIKCGNSLIDDPKIAGEKAFDWKKEFPTIFEKGGFDVIVGNPPYVLCQPSNTSETVLNFYKNYKVASYKIDLFHLFFEKSINILSQNGKLGFITPNTYLTNKFMKPLRAFILENSSINQLLNYENSVFIDAGVDVATLILQKEVKENNEIEIIKANNENWELTNLIKQNSWKEDGDNIFNIKEVFEINLEKCVSLNQICNSYFGIQAYDRKTSISDTKIDDNYKPIIDGGDIFPYSYSLPTKFFRFLEENIKSGGNYEVYAEERIVIRQIGLTPVVGLCRKEIVASNTLYNLNIKDNDFDINYILCVLNSTTIKHYWLSKYSDGKQLFPKIKGYQLKELPIPNIKKEAQQPFIALANQMLSLNEDFAAKKNRFLRRLEENFKLDKLTKKLDTFYNYDFSVHKEELKKKKIELTFKQQDEWQDYFEEYKKDLLALQHQIQTTDNQIDNLVFELYGLSEEEIKLIKEA